MRKFYHPFLYDSFKGFGADLPKGLKDGQVEEFVDVMVPFTDESGNVKMRPLENHHSLSLRSTFTGLVTTFVKWPSAYFGDKGKGPFTSYKKASDAVASLRELRFDSDGRRL